MILVNKVIFIYKYKNIHEKILFASGYFPFSKKGTLQSMSTQSYKKTLKNIDKFQKDLKNISLLPIEKAGYESLLRFSQARQMLLFAEYESAKVFARETRKILANTGKDKISTNNWLLFNAEFIEIQADNSLWIAEADYDYQQLENRIKLLNLVIEGCHTQYKGLEINSDEHLVIAHQHLESSLELAKLKVQKNDGQVVSVEKKQLGEPLLNKLEFFETKILSSIEFKNQPIFRSLILLEKIKLGFYLEKNPQVLFSQVLDFCKIHIDFQNDDPLGYATGVYWPNTVQELMIYKKQLCFRNYLYSFCLELCKTSEKKTVLKLKQLSNFLANDLNERLKITYSNKINDIKWSTNEKES